MTGVQQFDTLIVGGGQAGAQVAISLRSNGYAGTIGIVEATDNPPYERPPLSKAFLKGELDEEELLLRPVDFWAASEVELVLSCPVESIDLEQRAVQTGDGTRYGFANLVWAAGGRARQLPMLQGLSGVHTVRTLEDARALRAEMESATRAVIIGGGYIGLESAAVFRQQGIEVTVLEALDRLMQRVTSQPVSQFFLDLHRQQGVEVVLDAAIDSVESYGGAVSAVVLRGGRRLPADIVVVGVGLVPHTERLADAGVVCSNGVDVDEFGRTSAQGVYAVGDCAHRPTAFSAEKSRVRLESVANAVDQGKAVADAIVGKPQRVEAVPWFWSHQYHVKLQTAGLFNGYDEAVLRGSLSDEAFSVVYLKDGQLLALDCLQMTKDFAQGKFLLQAGARLDRDSMADASRPLRELVVEPVRPT